MDKGFKYRIYPTPSQRALIERTFGCCRWAFNEYLTQRARAWEENGGTLSASEGMKLIPGWKRDNPWLAEVDAVALQQAVRDCDKAFQNFFRRCKKGGAPGYPRYKSRKNPRQSYRTQNPKGRSAVEVFEAENRIKFPKLGLVKAKVSRPIEGRIVNATVSRDAAGRYFATVCCADCIEAPLPKSDKAVGIDLGVTDLVVCSDGTRFDNLKTTAKYGKKLAREQRRLSRKKKGSANCRKQRLRVARVHAKIADARRDHIHKATTKLIRENQAICAESLRPANMVRNRHLAKAVADASFGEICREFKYKAQWYGRDFVQADPWYPSTKTCSHCGHVQDMPLSERTYECPTCKIKMDRDLNAARNILAEGLRILNGTAGHAGTTPSGENACGEGVRPACA